MLIVLFSAINPTRLSSTNRCCLRRQHLLGTNASLQRETLHDRNARRHTQCHARLFEGPAKYGSREHKAKISAANKGRVFSADHCEKLSAARRGKFHGRPAMTPEQYRASQNEASKWYAKTERGAAARRAREKRAKKWLTESARDHARRKNAQKHAPD